jgi:hypothetical protein
LATIDGSTWDPFAERLLFTTENDSAPTYAATPGYPSTVTDVSGALGRGGYEGIQNDGAGHIFIVEDIGGTTKTGSTGGSTTAKRPNSFIYRYVPKSPGDLQNGKLQALQVMNVEGQPITFGSQAALEAPDQVELHAYGHSLKTRWVTLHDTAVDGHTPFDANTAAKAAGATPFKRPENGGFQPGTNFRSFAFDETGDTSATSPENGDAGGFGDVQNLVLDKNGENGVLRMIYRADEAHAAPDNFSFLSSEEFSYVQDMGDTLHTQSNALDSGFVFDIKTNYADPSNQPIRWLAEGRDASATLDSSFDGYGSNEGDNELTGTYVSNGDIGTKGILGATAPKLFHNGWRWFYTQQHGDNVTYEVVPSSSAS